MNVYHYGCVRQPGHFLRGPAPSLQYASDVERELNRIFGTLYLAPGKRDRGSYVTEDRQVEGQATLQYGGGYTALSFWDRSVDPRHGCVSTFVAEGTLDGRTMLEVCKASFPEIWGRFKFEVRIVEQPSDLKSQLYICAHCSKKGYGATLDGWGQHPPGWFFRMTTIRDELWHVCSVACALAKTRT